MDTAEATLKVVLDKFTGCLEHVYVMVDDKVMYELRGCKGVVLSSEANKTGSWGITMDSMSVSVVEEDPRSVHPGVEEY